MVFLYGNQPAILLTLFRKLQICRHPAVFPTEEQRITLVPYSEIPARERWLFENPAILLEMRRKLKAAAAAGRVSAAESSAETGSGSGSPAKPTRT